MEGTIKKTLIQNSEILQSDIIMLEHDKKHKDFTLSVPETELVFERFLQHIGKRNKKMYEESKGKGADYFLTNVIVFEDDDVAMLIPKSTWDLFSGIKTELKKATKQSDKACNDMTQFLSKHRFAISVPYKLARQLQYLQKAKEEQLELLEKLDAREAEMLEKGNQARHIDAKIPQLFRAALDAAEDQDQDKYDKLCAIRDKMVSTFCENQYDCKKYDQQRMECSEKLGEIDHEIYMKIVKYAYPYVHGIVRMETLLKQPLFLLNDFVVYYEDKQILHLCRKKK